MAAEGLIMKNRRREKILEIINKKDIYTQEELTGLLVDEGFSVTQATVSRDIRALKLVKTHGSDGKLKYTSILSSGDNSYGRIRLIFREGITSARAAGNIVVIKTLSGMANAVCTGIDALENHEILGTVAGDDTIMVVVENEAVAKRLVESIGSDNE